MRIARCKSTLMLRMSLVLLLSIITPPSAQAQEVRLLYAPLVAGQLLDWHSTRTALARPGTREMNALLQSCAESSPCLLGVKGAMTAAMIGFMELARKKHPKTAFWTTLGITLGMTAVAAHNYRQAR